jgi:membrane protease YdiL (CAAX protease family)
MNDLADNLPPPLPPEDAFTPPVNEPPHSPWPRVWATLAWVVILGVVGWQVVGRHLVARERGAAADSQLELLTMRMQARYLLGTRELVGVPGLYDQARALNTGSVAQRLRFVVLAGELAGPAEARSQLHKLDLNLAQNKRTYAPGEAATRALLDKLYTDYERFRFTAPSLSREDRQQLRESLGWFGELALAPDGRRSIERAALAAAGGPAAAAVARDAEAVPFPEAREAVLASARRTFWGIVGVAGGGCLFGVAGVAGLVVFLVFVLRGKVPSRVQCGSPHGGIYAETFALWLVLFLGISLAGALVLHEVPRLLLGGAALLLSLAALAWPVLRGVPWRQVRADIGLNAGRGPVVESSYGLLSYGIGLPLLAVGLLLVLLLILLERMLTGAGGGAFDQLTGPSHPAVFEVAQGDFWARLEVLLLACVAAPLVEETMFRGVLYRHLREGTHRLGTGWSIVLSATVVSFLFAAIHPQGLVAVPALMALAYAFTLAREWRGTLLPAMVAHGVNNAVVMTFTMMALGD